ncbi:MAG: hypothetical protein JWN21_483 [Sphingomonas bacterium]|uniref:hypothetical protein n=1 Tax=Sphingomonas bacterium TaxID=1895847 RepID=UPI0026110503|nr:hypothetical protein [Sphingomonas bacterium]MDB5694940.1 hypothetical protein [Sphingomonas bacterium]
MSETSSRSPNAATLSLVAATGALAGWWWQSRSREAAVEERTRVRLRAWSMR